MEKIPLYVGLHSIITWQGFSKFNPCNAILSALTSSPTKNVMKDCWDWNTKGPRWKDTKLKRNFDAYYIGDQCKWKSHNIKLNTTQRWWWILQCTTPSIYNWAHSLVPLYNFKRTPINVYTRELSIMCSIVPLY